VKALTFINVTKATNSPVINEK